MRSQTFQVPFPAHVELLRFFLSHRQALAERIQGLLNAQRKPADYLRDASLLSADFEDCFFTFPGISQAQLRLKGQLEAAHWASGFKPRVLPGLHNGLIDPAEMMIRAFHLWQRTRWPGRNGRLRYAHTLFNLYLLRCLELLSVRVWDADARDAAHRLAQVQDVLDHLWKHTPADQPILIRDARWLIPLAQSPATDDLGAYFDVAEQVAAALPGDDRVAINTAAVRMAAGHLRSQIRYYATKKGGALDEPSVVLNTRSSNALDFALLIQDLVPVLDAYEHACRCDDRATRRELADAICQGISPDPDLFVNRVELLGAYSMIEHLFITTDAEGHATYTPMGRRHVELIEAYGARIGRVAQWLRDDCAQFRPVTGAYSPYGALYGFSTDLIEHMAFKTLQADAVTRFGLEDVFASGDTHAEKLAWVTGWRKLPHLAPDVQRLFDYPQQFADDVFDRMAAALRTRVSAPHTTTAVPTGRLIIVAGDGPAAHRAEAYDETQLLSDRQEGRCLLSYRTPSGWVAIKKALLTDVLGRGHDATIAGLPAAAAEALTLMGRQLVKRAEN